MNARKREDMTRRALSAVIGSGGPRRSRRKGRDHKGGSSFSTKREGDFVAPEDVARGRVLRRSSVTVKGKTPHSAKSPEFATILNFSDDLGMTTVTHPLIVITGDEPSGLAVAMDALRRYRNPVDLAILASWLIDPANIHNQEWPGGGSIPQTQALVFSRPGKSSDLRIRVVPDPTKCPPLVPFADWSRTLFPPARGD